MQRDATLPHAPSAMLQTITFLAQQDYAYGDRVRRNSCKIYRGAPCMREPESFQRPRAPADTLRGGEGPYRASAAIYRRATHDVRDRGRSLDIDRRTAGWLILLSTRLKFPRNLRR